MRAQKILLATDLSQAAGPALEWATALAQATGAALWIVHVEPGSPTAEFGSIYLGLSDPGIAEKARALAAVRPTHPDVPYEHRILRGATAAELLKIIAAEAIDAVVLDAHPQKHLLKLLGGTIETIVHKAPCPVMVCRG